MKISAASLAIGCALIAGVTPGLASQCFGNADALGTSRVIQVNPAELSRVGHWDFPETLPLEDHEVVLTFDDGPMPGKTERVLDILKGECVRVTFFVVGRMLRAHPELVRREEREGHSIGTHTQTHRQLIRTSLPAAERDIQAGISSATAVLGHAPAPFFRAPYLSLSPKLEAHLRSKGLMVWSIDVHTGDWEPVSPDQIVRRAMARLARAGRGILLLHDIHERTVRALPGLLNELKMGGYKVVHVEPKAP
jgi:peptidoglycan-N-acetylglucosamine deacetylase